MFNSFINVPLNAIDFNDLRYQIEETDVAGEKETRLLEKSLTGLGVVQPLLLKENNGVFVIVSGFRRAFVLKIQKQSAPALVLKSGKSETELDLICIKVAITQRAFQKALSVSGVIKSIRLLNEHLGVNEIAGLSGQVFNQDFNPKIVEDYIRISELPASVYPLLSKGHLSFKPCLKIADQDDDTVGSFLMLFTHINASVSHQLDIVDLCIEIMRREKMTLETLLKDPGIMNIMNNDQVDLRAKAGQIITFLKKEDARQSQSRKSGSMMPAGN